MTAGVRVREARADDVPAIVALLRGLDLPGENREGDPCDPAYARAFADIAADPRQCVLVAVDDTGAVRGTLTLALLPNLSHRGRPVAQFESVVVDPAWRRQGIGEALVDEALRRAQAAGWFRAQLTSRVERVDAHRFWRRLGFLPTHTGFKLAL